MYKYPDLNVSETNNDAIATPTINAIEEDNSDESTPEVEADEVEASTVDRIEPIAVEAIEPCTEEVVEHFIPDIVETNTMVTADPFVAQSTHSTSIAIEVDDILKQKRQKKLLTLADNSLSRLKNEKSNIYIRNGDGLAVDDGDVDKTRQVQHLPEEGHPPELLTATLYDDDELREMVNLCHKGIAYGCRHANVGNGNAEVRARKINYGRFLHMISTLDQVFMARMYDKPDYNLMRNNSKCKWVTDLLHDTFLNGLHHMGMKPFQEYILNGNALLFLEQMTDACSFLALNGRQNVVHGYYVYLNSLRSMVNRRKDLLKIYMSNCTSCNDVFIELLNSLIAHMINNPNGLTAEVVGYYAVLTQIKRDILDAADEDLGLKSTSSTRPGEVLKDMERYVPKEDVTQDTIEEQVLYVRLMGIFKRYASIDKSLEVIDVRNSYVLKRMVKKKAVYSHVYPSSNVLFADINTVANLVMRGQEITFNLC